jgi:hypothetical protein
MPHMRYLAMLVCGMAVVACIEGGLIIIERDDAGDDAPEQACQFKDADLCDASADDGSTAPVPTATASTGK